MKLLPFKDTRRNVQAHIRQVPLVFQLTVPYKLLEVIFSAVFTFKKRQTELKYISNKNKN